MRKQALALTLILAIGACARQVSTKTGTANPVGPNSTSTAPQAQAEGTINGGGGVGIRCADGKLEMLDLFEARRRGLSPLPAPTSLEEAINLVSARVAAHFWNIDTIPMANFRKMLVDTWIRAMFSGGKISNPETKKDELVKYVDHLELSNDFGKYELPAGCHLEQIAFFSDANVELSIVQSKFGELDWLSKSFLVTHEVAYLADRREGLNTLRPNNHITSQYARRFVGQMMSVEGVPTHADHMPLSQPMYTCSEFSEPPRNLEKMTYFYTFVNPATGKLSAVFNVIHGKEELYQMRVDFRTLKPDDLFNEATGPLEEIRPLELTGLGEASGFSVRLNRENHGKLTLTLYFLDHGQTAQLTEPQTLTCDSRAINRNP